MKKLIFLFSVICLSTFAQPGAYRGKFYDVPGGGYGGDTAISYGLINRNTLGSCGYYMVSGTDTAWVYVDSSGIAYLYSDNGWYVIGGMTSGGLTGDSLQINWINVDSLVYTPFIYGGNLSTSDLTIKATSGVGASGSNIEFQRGDGGVAFQIDNGGNALFNGKLGIGSNLPISKLAVVGSGGSNIFNFVNSSINKNRSTIAEATDTSSLSLNFASNNNLRLFMRGSSGNHVFSIDSTLIMRYGQNSGTYTTRDVVFSSSTSSASDQFEMFLVSTSTSASTTGAALYLNEDDGAALGNGHCLGAIYFQSTTSGSHSLIESASIKAFSSETWGSGKAGSRLSFSTTPSTTATPVEQMSIANNGAITLTSNFLTQDSLTTRGETSRVFSAGTITMTASLGGGGMIVIDSSGVTLKIMYVHWDADGTTAIDQEFGKGYIATSTSNTAGTISFYDGGSSAILKNNLPYSTTFKIKVIQ